MAGVLKPAMRRDALIGSLLVLNGHGRWRPTETASAADAEGLASGGDR